MKIIYNRKAKTLFIDGEGHDLKVPFVIESDDLKVECKNINLVGAIINCGMVVTHRIEPTFRERVVGLWRKVFPKKHQAPQANSMWTDKTPQYGVKKENL
jgi:hypothetical protein